MSNLSAADLDRGFTPASIEDRNIISDLMRQVEEHNGSAHAEEQETCMTEQNLDELCECGHTAEYHSGGYGDCMTGSGCDCRGFARMTSPQPDAALSPIKAVRYFTCPACNREFTAVTEYPHPPCPNCDIGHGIASRDEQPDAQPTKEWESIICAGCKTPTICAGSGFCSNLGTAQPTELPSLRRYQPIEYDEMPGEMIPATDYDAALQQIDRLTGTIQAERTLREQTEAIVTVLREEFAIERSLKEKAEVEHESWRQDCIAETAKNKTTCGLNRWGITMGCGGEIYAESIIRCSHCAVPFCKDCANLHFNDALVASEAENARLRSALEALKLRIHFIGWPTEPMWAGCPDWRKEINLLEDALSPAEGKGGL